jgi:hypothetical protein
LPPIAAAAAVASPAKINIPWRKTPAIDLTATRPIVERLSREVKAVLLAEKT